METLVAIISLFAVMQSQPNWELQKEGDGIKVYTAGSESSKFKQFKVEADVAASAQQIPHAVTDLENNYKWFESVKKGEMIELFSKDEYIFKQVVKVPFPFKDREVVQYCTVRELEDGVIRIDLKHKNDAIPEDGDYVRMPYAVGYWILTPNGTTTQIEYSFLADPGGNIPAWLANQFIVDNPFKTIKALREYLKDA
jgi:hypothetical protein